jgi:hypothetical protein
VVPPVRTRDSVELPYSTYVIRIAGVEAGRGVAPAGKVLALGDNLDTLPGSTTVEPVFGLAGKWIPSEMRHSAELTGATVIDRVSVVVTHLSSIITANAARLLSREDVRVLTEGVKQVSPSAVDELVPGLLTLAEVQRVLQGLLIEQVPINDLPRIYEALALRAKMSTDPEGLVEAARQALGPALTARHVDGSAAAGDHDRPPCWSSPCSRGCDRRNWVRRSSWTRTASKRCSRSLKDSVERVGGGGQLGCAGVCASTAAGHPPARVSTEQRTAGTVISGGHLSPGEHRDGRGGSCRRVDFSLRVLPSPK